jgi:acyl-CoA thioesterase
MDRTHTAELLIEQYLKHNAFTELLGLTFSLTEPGSVTYRLTIESKHLATPGFLHGGVITTLLDATMGAGAMSLVADEWKVVSTMEMQVNFLQPGRVGQLIEAQSEVLRKGKGVIFMKAILRNEDNAILAVANGSFYPFDAGKAGYTLI